MKTVLVSFLTIFLLIGCEKEKSLENQKVWPFGDDEGSVQELSTDTILAVINPPFNDLYDMDVFIVYGPAVVTVANYDMTQWPCALLLKEYDESNGGTIPVQQSATHEITITKEGLATVTVQKADESCGGIVPYKIVSRP